MRRNRFVICTLLIMVLWWRFLHYQFHNRNNATEQLRVLPAHTREIHLNDKQNTSGASYIHPQPPFVDEFILLPNKDVSDIDRQGQKNKHILLGEPRQDQMQDEDSVNGNVNQNVDREEINDNKQLQNEDRNSIDIVKHGLEDENNNPIDFNDKKLHKDETIPLGIDNHELNDANENTIETLGHGINDTPVVPIEEKHDLLEENFKPNEVENHEIHTSKVNPTEVNFITNPEHLCDGVLSYMTLLILVPSVPSKAAAREAIRSTYGSFARKPLVIKDLTVHVRLAFLIGKDDNPLSDAKILEESKTFGDVIYVDYVEQYRGLTRKILMGLKWVSEYCKGLDFLLKIDDDVFVNVPFLATSLHSMEFDTHGAVFGFLQLKAPVMRTGRWAVSRREYHKSRYPTYTQGGSYVISGDLVPKMFNASQDIPYFPMEDVYITGFVARQTGAKYVSMPNFNQQYQPEYTACQFVRNKRITLHGVSVKKLYLFWATLKNFNTVCQ